MFWAILVKIEKNNCYGCVHLCYYLDYYNVGTNVSIWVIRRSPKTVVKGNSAIVIIVGAGSAILLDYMYNEHYELLYKFFLAIGVIGVVIYALGISFF